MSEPGDTKYFSSLRTVFVDRDGVLNRKALPGQYVASVSEFQVLEGVPEAIGKLNRAGIRVIVVSNQRGIARGVLTEENLRGIHAELKRVLGERGAHLDGIYYCPHDGKNCTCRKPLRGMYDQAVADFPGIEPATSVMIGDSLGDIQFGRNVGMSTIFIEGDVRTQDPGAAEARALADIAFADLPGAVDALLAQITNH